MRHTENDRSVWAFPRISGVLETEFMNLSEQRWLESYRVPKRTFQQLVHSLQGVERAATRMRRPVPVVTIVVMLLKRLGKGLDYREIGDEFGVGASTAGEKVNTAMWFLIETKKYMISRLQEGRNSEVIIEGFFIRWNFPQCVGAIDSTYIPIKTPQNHHTDYFNRKSFHSVIVQAVCDSEFCITDICAGWPGKAHDARVLSRSKIGEKLINGTVVAGHNTLARDINGTAIEPFLVGDPAYPFCKHLMKDFTGSNLSSEKEYFNYRLNCARIQIERTFEGDAGYLEEWDSRDAEEMDELPALGPLSDDVGVGNAQLIRSVLCQYITEN
ncbi:putative nuclease HARBI1 [Stylophora pistillata]|uniref:Putative nuclease HARBI1 n=1 Tax=Stylophora pistillata TaxID=50429 RepID=A0A2B4RCQ5_STYPI|nr:putative nuclease HARBI1 [Stylophora pistillata]PFX15431.1 putative nuclease HARBI1 [Stylophora pistillata]